MIKLYKVLEGPTELEDKDDNKTKFTAKLFVKIEPEKYYETEIADMFPDATFIVKGYIKKQVTDKLTVEEKLYVPTTVVYNDKEIPVLDAKPDFSLVGNMDHILKAIYYNNDESVPI